MRQIVFDVGGATMRSHDSGIVLAGEDPRDVLVESVVQNVATSIEVTVGDVTMHLAAWQDPDHWAEDWAAKLGIDLEAAADAVDEMVAAAVVER